MEPTVKIGFFGCGNVGSGVWKLLTGFSKEISHRTGLHFEVKRALVRDVHKKREIELPEGVLTDRVDDLLNDPEISIILAASSPRFNGIWRRWKRARRW